MLGENCKLPLSTPLPPGENYQTTVVFDLPSDIQNPTLLIHEREFETRLVIGPENSLLHKKTKLQIWFRVQVFYLPQMWMATLFRRRKSTQNA